MPLLLKIAQYSGFALTQFTNLLLLFLIFTKASTRFGSYKYLMASFAAFSLIYSFVEISTQPIHHANKAVMYVYVNSFLKYEKSISNPLAAAYCASFGLCISLLATHFVYRYCAVCRTNDLQGWKLIRLFVLPLIFAVVGYLACAILLMPTELKSDFVRQEILETYNEDIMKVGYIALLYYYTDKSGNFTINWMDFVAYGICCGIMFNCFITMIICGWKTFRKMNDVKKSMSEKTKELNNQLFKTLVFQTLVPLCTMFAPVGTLVTLPIFSIGIPPILSNTISFNIAIYPALDAMIIIFMIRDFRNAVLCRKSVHPSMISTVPFSKYRSSTTTG